MGLIIVILVIWLLVVAINSMRRSSPPATIAAPAPSLQPNDAGASPWRMPIALATFILALGVAHVGTVFLFQELLSNSLFPGRWHHLSYDEPHTYLLPFTQAEWLNDRATFITAASPLASLFILTLVFKNIGRR